MKRASIMAIVPVAVLLAFALCTISESAAEPIAGGDAAATPATPATPAPAATTPAQSQEIKDAVARFREQDIEGCLKMLKEAVKKDPELSPANVMLAQFFAQANRGDLARNALERAVLDNPDDPEAYVLMGSIAMREGRVTEARLLFEKANSLTDKVSDAKRKKNLLPAILGGLAMTSEARTDWAGAQRHLEAWLKLDPENTTALTQLGQVLLQQKDETGALEQFTKASKIDEQLAKENKTESKLLSPEASLAEFYARTNDQKNAAKWMVTAINKKPRDAKIRLLAGQWALETGKLTDAKKQAGFALEIDPKSLNAKILCGVVALFQKDYPTAETYFQQALLDSPDNFAASNDLALALIEQKDTVKQERAAKYADDNYRRYAKTNQAAAACSTYGWVLYKLGRIDDAEKLLRAAASGGGLTPDTAYYLARVLNKSGHVKDAKDLLDRALQSTVPFQHRDDAQAMLDDLKKN